MKLQEVRIAGLQKGRTKSVTLSFLHAAILQFCNVGVMFILDSLLIGSLRFVLDKVVAAAEAEANDDSALRDRLLEAQMQLELGEITDEEFAAIERDVLLAIREIKGRGQGPISMSPDDKITGVDIQSFDESEK